jgi:hypothetical protein
MKLSVAFESVHPVAYKIQYISVSYLHIRVFESNSRGTAQGLWPPF